LKLTLVKPMRQFKVPSKPSDSTLTFPNVGPRLMRTAKGSFMDDRFWSKAVIRPQGDAPGI
jgi:hypothetical protein